MQLRIHSACSLVLRVVLAAGNGSSGGRELYSKVVSPMFAEHNHVACSRILSVVACVLKHSGQLYTMTTVRIFSRVR
jgi:hypothetical protein